MISQEVEPIRPGYPIELRISFPRAFWDAEQLATGRLVAQLRPNVPGGLLFEADTATGTVQREADRTVVIFLDDAATQKMVAASMVIFDFARIDAGDRRAIAGYVIWPVQRTVTRDVE